MGDFDNLAAEMTRRERNHKEVRERSTSNTALAAWDESGFGTYFETNREAFTTGFDLGRDTAANPITDYARIAVLQTEREYVRRELARNGFYERQHTGSTPLSRLLDDLDAAIRGALT